MKQEMIGWQWLDHVQIIYTLLQTANHTSTSIFTGPNALPDATPEAHHQLQVSAA